jgi:hypothetical protein
MNNLYVITYKMATPYHFQGWVPYNRLSESTSSLPSLPVNIQVGEPVIEPAHSERRAGSSTADTPSKFDDEISLAHEGPSHAPSAQQGPAIRDIGVSEVFGPLDGNPQAEYIFYAFLLRLQLTTSGAALFLFMGSTATPKTPGWRQTRSSGLPTSSLRL